ncbi:hypothetical protein O999_21845 [Pseudomonas putida LF54]|nr:hypothetical protein O999_21845 [Pseudomonas putida LF54]
MFDKVFRLQAAPGAVQPLLEAGPALCRAGLES